VYVVGEQVECAAAIFGITRIIEAIGTALLTKLLVVSNLFTVPTIRLPESAFVLLRKHRWGYLETLRHDSESSFLRKRWASFL
jgi:hypothetical protein